MHMGDVFNNNGYPFIDADSGGEIDGMIAFCRAVLEELSPDEEFIPQVWFISVLGEGVRPAAKTYMDLKVSEICEKAKLGTPSPVLEFTVVADDASKRRRSRAVRRRPGKPTARPRSRSSQVIEARISAEFDEALTKKLHRICTGGGPAGAQRPH